MAPVTLADIVSALGGELRGPGELRIARLASLAAQERVGDLSARQAEIAAAAALIVQNEANLAQARKRLADWRRDRLVPPRRAANMTCRRSPYCPSQCSIRSHGCLPRLS